MSLEFKNFTTLVNEEKLELLELRNSFYVRNFMVDDSIINKESHFNWIEELKDDTKSEYFAIYFKDELVGSLSYKLEENSCSWGVYFKEALPLITLPSICVYIFLEHLFINKEFEEINSLVRVSNINAHKFNKSFGFQAVKEDDEYFYLNLLKENWKLCKDLKRFKIVKKYLDEIEYKFIF